VKFLLSYVLIGIFFLGCKSAQVNELRREPNYFEKKEGCFLLYNMKTNSLEKVIGENNCKVQYPACSSFKVPLAVMALDAHILNDENQVLKWNGIKDEREESNRDHNAKTWMSQSIVWFSQRITQQMGPKKFQKYLDAFEYGNKDIKGGLNQAWLVSPASSDPALKISAYEQMEFMKKLWRDQLPASERAMKITRDLTYLETSPKGFKLHGKTGSNFYDKDRKVRLGWFVSHLQNETKEYVVITNFRDLEPFEGKGYGGLAARELTKNILSNEGLW
jgi:beta-lactamase class D